MGNYYKWDSKYHGTTRISKYADGTRYEEQMTHRQALQDIADAVANGGVFAECTRALHEEFEDNHAEYAYYVKIIDDEGHTLEHVWFDFS